MFSWIKAVKRYVAPALLSIGRLVGSTGQALWTIPKFTKYLTGQDHHPANLPASIIAASCNIIINLAIRVPSLFQYFSNKARVQKPGEKEPPVFCTCGCNNCCDMGQLKLPAYFLYQFLLMAAKASAKFGGLGSALGAVTVSEIIAAMAGDDNIYDDNKDVILVQLFAAYIAMSNVYSIFSRPMKPCVANMYAFALGIQENTLPRDKYVIYTILITLAGMACTPGQGYFSTSYALTKLHWVTVPDEVRNVAGILSGFSASIFQIFTQGPAVYAWLKYPAMPQRVMEQSRVCWDKPVTKLVDYVGAVDAIATGISGYTGNVMMTKNGFHYDPNPVLIAPFILAASSTALMHYIFNVKANHRDTMLEFYRQRLVVPYTQLPQKDLGRTVVPVEQADIDIENNFKPETSPEEIDAFDKFVAERYPILPFFAGSINNDEEAIVRVEFAYSNAAR